MNNVQFLQGTSEAKNWHDLKHESPKAERWRRISLIAIGLLLLTGAGMGAYMLFKSHIPAGVVPLISGGIFGPLSFCKSYWLRSEKKEKEEEFKKPLNLQNELAILEKVSFREISRRNLGDLVRNGLLTIEEAKWVQEKRVSAEEISKEKTEVENYPNLLAKVKIDNDSPYNQKVNELALIEKEWDEKRKNLEVIKLNQ